MSSALREFKSRLYSPVRLGFFVGVTLFCALASPFHTSEAFGTFGSALFWPIAVALAMSLAVALDQSLEKFDDTLGVVGGILMKTGLFSMIYSAFIIGLSELFYQHEDGDTVSFWYLFFNIFTIYAVVTTSIHFIKPVFRTNLPEPVEAEPAFLKRLAPKLGTALMRVSSQDHYVEVQTEAGKDLILMRFADAVGELQGYDGVQVHRSHWVSRAAVADVDRKKGKIALILKDGTEVPVSRSFKADAETAGLI